MERLKEKVISKLQIDGSKLKDYKYINELHELTTGAYIRWVNMSNISKLTNGGFVVRVEIEDDGIKIICKNNTNAIFQLWMDECIIFQKLTIDEQIIKRAMELA